MGDIADWLTEKAMTDAEAWFEDDDMAVEIALDKGPPFTHTNYNTGEPCFCDDRFGGLPGPCIDQPEPMTGTSPENGSG